MVRSNTLLLVIMFSDLLDCENKTALGREFSEINNSTVSVDKWWGPLDIRQGEIGGQLLHFFYDKFLKSRKSFFPKFKGLA